MRKRISLAIIGFVLFLGAFLLYQLITGASILGTKAPPPPKVPVIDPNQPLSIQERLPTGELLYVLYAKKATPITDPITGKLLPDQYNLDQPSATYYEPRGQTYYIRADNGTIAVDTTKGHKRQPFGGKLSGHIKLVISPRDLAIDTSQPPQPGQIEVTLDKDVDMSVTDSMLTSPGGVHVRSEDIAFDGENLTVAFNRTQQRIEYLRIDPSSGKDNEIIIRHLGQGDTSFLGGLSEGKSNTRTAATALASNNSVATAPATLPTAEAKADAYKLSFGENVHAKLGASELSADRMYVLFMQPARNKNRANLLNPAAQTPPASQPTLAATTPVDKKIPPNTNDLRVTWTGPMEMRPLGPTDMVLTDEKDRALEAVGTAAVPVIVKDGNSTVKAGRLWYHKAEDRVELESDQFGYVEVKDSSIGSVACHRVSYFMADDKLNLEGPGTLEIPQRVLHREGLAPDAKPLMVTWSKNIAATLASAGDPANVRKKAIHHANLTGDVEIKDASFDMTADALDLLLATNADKGKNSQALEHLLATGNVRIQSARPNFPLDDKPQGMNTDRLEIFTQPATAIAAPVLSRLLATGDVIAWTYANPNESLEQPPSDNKEKRLVRQSIATPNLDVALEPKDRATANPAATNPANTSFVFGSGAGVKSLLADHGVRVEIEGFEGSANQTVIATANSLVSDPRTGKATLKGDAGLGQPNGIPQKVIVTMGDSRISGDEILLDQKARLDPKGLAHSIEIPGPGNFIIAEMSKVPGEKPTTAQITWTQKMTYDERSRLARFLGHIESQTLDRPDQDNKMTCEEFLEVKLAESGATPAPGKEKGSSIDHLIAKGDVQASGQRYDLLDKTKVLTRMYIRTNEIRYTEANKILEIPGPGGIRMEDYRDKPQGANTNSGIAEFHWQGNTTYTGDTGLITMNKDVHVHYTPSKPMKMNAAGGIPGPADNNAPVKNIDLYGDSLIAHLLQNPTPGSPGHIANPTALSAGNEPKLSSATAQGNARLSVGDDEASADTLDYNAITNIATARGKGSEPAHFVRPGQDMLNAQELRWNTATGEVWIEHSSGTISN